jgi:dephospho-CoA kinase
MRVIGLTGGIGAGKSVVSAYLEQKGFVVIDADRISREVIAPGSTALKALAERFGGAILLENGALDRKKLASLAFADEEILAAMNSIVHEKIFEHIFAKMKLLEESGLKTIFLDAPLLIETGFHRTTDEVWLVEAKKETRIRRATRRGEISREEVLARMRAQMSQEEKRTYAGVIIGNDGTMAELYDKIDGIVAERLGR